MPVTELRVAGYRSICGLTAPLKRINVSWKVDGATMRSGQTDKRVYFSADAED